MRDPFPQCPKFLLNVVTPICNTINLTTLPLHIHEFLAAFLLYHFINVYVSPKLSSRLFPKTYNTLSRRNRINWDVHVVSLVQSTIICAISLYAIIVDKERANMGKSERVWGYTGLAGLVQALGAGYFAWDLMISTQYVKIFGLGLLAHAICALCVFSLGFRPFVNYYAPNFLLYELSSPFLNFHWFMDKLQMTGSTVQLVNGICLLVVFFSCRLIYGTYSSYRVGTDIFQAWMYPSESIVEAGQQIPTWLGLAYVASNMTLHFLNFYWFNKMISALRKRFESTPAEIELSKISQNTGRVADGATNQADSILVEGTNVQVQLPPGQSVTDLRKRM